MLFAIMFFTVGTLGPAHRSSYYWLIVPLPAAVALILGWRAWSSKHGKSTAYATAALLLLAFVLIFSHLLPRSGA